MNDILRAQDDRWMLRFERHLAHPPEKVWRAVTEAEHLSRWYPLTASEIDLRVGGTIRFHDDEGAVLHAEITHLVAPHRFAFRELDETGSVHEVDVELEADGDGCRLVFIHTFADAAWAAHTAAGWYRCLEALRHVVAGETPVWPDNALELREAYAKEFGVVVESVVSGEEGARS